jgi:hypothetical protein
MKTRSFNLDYYLNFIFKLFFVFLIIGCENPVDPEPDKGKASFWMKSDLNVGYIDVYVEGNFAGRISHYHQSGITCGDGDVNIIKPSGSYNWSAVSENGTKWAGTLTISKNNCIPIELTNSSGGGGSTTGQGLFWVSSDLGCGNISVNVNGITRTVSGYHSSAPNCGDSGAATFSLSPGTYSFSASCNGKSWSGNINIVAGSCSKIQLTNSSSGGGSGRVAFWTNKPQNCGNINVSVWAPNNQVGLILTTYYNSAPSCSSNPYYIDLPPGTYPYSATCNGKSWKGSVTVTSGGCVNVLLQ